MGSLDLIPYPTIMNDQSIRSHPKDSNTGKLISKIRIYHQPMSSVENFILRLQEDNTEWKFLPYFELELRDCDQFQNIPSSLIECCEENQNLETEYHQYG